jgi:hypothetical protein
MARDSEQSEQIGAQLRELVYSVLIDKVRHDQYPSATMMNMIEEGVDSQAMQEYVGVLLDKIASDRFPSIPMVNRVLGLL